MTRKLSHDETSYFCEQLALMLNAGMELGNGIEILCEDIEDKKIQAVCKSLMDGLNNNETLGQTMKNSGYFPEYAVKMVNIGEMTGRLQTVLEGLSEFYQTRAELDRSIRSAVLHPLMLLAMMTAVIVVLIVLVIPMFGEIFSQFDASITGVVKSTVDFAYGFGITLLIVLLAVIVLSVVCAAITGFQPVKKAFAGFAAVFPLTKRISRQFSLSRIAGAMSMMVESGISPDEMLEITADLVNDKKLKDKLLKARERVLNGEFFADVISTAGIFPAIYAKSLKIAYSSGHFDNAWKKLSERCTDAAMESSSGIVAFIEPAIVIVLTTVIGAILLSVMIPLVNIMSVLG